MNEELYRGLEQACQNADSIVKLANHLPNAMHITDEELKKAEQLQHTLKLAFNMLCDVLQKPVYPPPTKELLERLAKIPGEYRPTLVRLSEDWGISTYKTKQVLHGVREINESQRLRFLKHI